jgi:ankyrin repeat protein
LNNNHNATAAYLLNKHSDLADGKGYSGCPWMYIRDIEFARKLVKNCTDINTSLLSCDGAIRYLRTAEFAKLIIDAGANKDALTHLLETSCRDHNDIPFAQALINAGADVGSLDVEHLGMCNDVEILKLFLDNGADPNLCDDCSGSVLNTRIRERDNDLESIELLLQRGADPNMLTESEDLDEEDNVIATYKETSLEYAVEISSSIEIIKLLIKYGADVNVKHYDGRSLVDMALDNGDVEIAELLKQHGAVAHETPMTAAEKTPVEWIEEYFGDKVAELRTKSGWTAPEELAYVATETPFKYGLNKTNFSQCLQKLGIKYTNYDRCIMIFDNHGATWGSKTNGGIITLDGIWWSEMDDKVVGFEWKDVNSIVTKNGAWKGNFIEVNGQYVVLKAMGDDFLGTENFVRFLSDLSGCQAYKA